MKKWALILFIIIIMSSLILEGCSSQSPATSSPTSAPSAAPQPASSGVPQPTSTAAASPSQSTVKPIILKVVTAFDLQVGTNYIIRRLIDRINKESNGQLVLQYTGSVEAIPGPNQPQAVRTGLVDIVVIPHSYYPQEFPEGSITQLSTLTWAQERQTGFLDYWRQLHRQRMNVYYLGGVNKAQGFAFVLKKPITTPVELKGQKFRLGPGYNTFYDALGIVGVNMPVTETYSSLQQGIVTGQYNTLANETLQRLWEVAPNFIDQQFWPGNAMGVLINLDKWNSLPKNLQDLLNNTEMELEPETEAFQLKDWATNRQMWMDNKATPIKLSDADTKSMIAISQKAVWDIVTPKSDPATLAKIKELLKLQ